MKRTGEGNALRHRLRAGLAAALMLGLGAPAWAQQVAPGTYLAARAAGQAGDFAQAARLFDQALQEDPSDPWLLENALASLLGLGRFDDAQEVAVRMVEAGTASQLAHLVLFAGHAREGDWRAILEDLEAGRSVGPLVDGLARAWARMGLGETEAALSAFDEVATEQGLKAFGLTHKALALASTGDLAGAEAILALPEEEGMQRTRRGVLAHAEILSELGRNDEAVALIDETFGRDLDATLTALRARLAAGEAVPYALVTTPAEGLAEVLLNVAGALGEEDAHAALMYARAALALDPNLVDAALLAATRLEAMDQPALARAAFALVPEDDPAHVAAELGRAASLRRAEEGAAAVEALSRLARSHPELADVQASLGDALRGEERMAEAEEAYTRAIELYGEDTEGALWWVHFTRAMAREAQGDWPGAEADLRRALEIEPSQPQVLNHLGYSLVDRGEKLEEALGLIEEAVTLRPDSGAIVDSLGWAYYRLGRFEEAVEQLELASTLLPTDPVINDHLGDAYWMVGREREARFQWSRALSFEPEPEEAERIRRKLAEGLDAVLAAEGASAVDVAEDMGG